MKVRPSQLETLYHAALQGFENRAVEVLQKLCPREWELLGPDTFRHKVRLGLERARKNQLASENALLLFTHLTFLLGIGFDRDPQTPWAAEILSDTSIDEVERVEKMYQRSAAHCQETLGAKGEFIDAVLRKLPNEPSDGFKESGLSDFEKYMLRRYLLLYPEKFRSAGEERLMDLIQSGTREAASYGLTSERGRTLFLVLAFLLGSEFAKDPQYPLALDQWSESERNEPDLKAGRVRQQALAYLKRWQTAGADQRSG